MSDEKLENLSLHIKLQEAMAKPYFAATRKAAVSSDFISRLKADSPRSTFKISRETAKTTVSRAKTGWERPQPRRAH